MIQLAEGTGPYQPQLRTTHEREVRRVPWRSLDQELVSPTVERLEALRIVHIVHEHAAVGSAIEGDTE